MSNKLLILAIILGLAMSLGLVFACGDDDDDNDTSVDDDAVDDDAADDDVDDDAAYSCTDAMTYFWDECGLQFEEYTLEDLIAWCDEGTTDWVNATYDCVVDFYGDCTAVEECYNAIE